MRRSVRVQKRSVQKKNHDSAPDDNRPAGKAAATLKAAEKTIRSIDALLR